MSLIDWGTPDNDWDPQSLTGGSQIIEWGTSVNDRNPPIVDSDTRINALGTCPCMGASLLLGPVQTAPSLPTILDHPTAQVLVLGRATPRDMLVHPPLLWDIHVTPGRLGHSRMQKQKLDHNSST
jgi:hypothetical protein